MNKKVMLNLGCGATRPQNWINTDSSLNAQVQKIPVLGDWLAKAFIKSASYSSDNVVYMNLNTKWGFASESVDVVYASHLFEHLSHRAATLFLSESYRTLKPGAVVRIVVPDLYKTAKKYVSEYEEGDSDASKSFLWAINMGLENMYPYKSNSFLKKTIARWQEYPHQHKYMYDELSLRVLLAAHGFQDVKSLTYGVSDSIEEIKDVEGDREHYISIYMEARK
ncbi:MAG TPA: methyltransferase domain-containing protein [Puia sp.]|jgi:hypothetical protein|nr:methyltransferase domain-containing protein [Puia sp.]